jgi:hypothetical protein
LWCHGVSSQRIQSAAADEPLLVTFCALPAFQPPTWVYTLPLGGPQPSCLSTSQESSSNKDVAQSSTPTAKTPLRRQRYAGSRGSVSAHVSPRPDRSIPRQCLGVTSFLSSHHEFEPTYDAQLPYCGAESRETLFVHAISAWVWKGSEFPECWLTLHKMYRPAGTSAPEKQGRAETLSLLRDRRRKELVTCLPRTAT